MHNNIIIVANYTFTAIVMNIQQIWPSIRSSVLFLVHKCGSNILMQNHFGFCAKTQPRLLKTRGA